MTFEARNFTDNDRAYCDSLSIKSPVSKGYPRCFLEDKVRNKFFMSFGGKGGLPANTGEPPDYYAIASENLVLYVGLRFDGSKRDTENGGEILYYKIEESYGEGDMDKALLTEALLVYKQWISQQAGTRNKVTNIVVEDTK